MRSIQISVWLPLAALVGSSSCVRQEPARREVESKITYGSEGEVRLQANASTPGVVILDYETLAEGFPTFEVVSAEGDASVLEFTYSDTLAGVALYHGDGPYPLASTMDTYRINRYNVSGAAGQVFTNRLIQGGFRYQKLNLSSPGEVVLRHIGVKPTVDTTPLTELPGSFQSSDEELNRIWLAGAKTAQMTQAIKNSIPLFWEVTEDGVLVDSLAPQAAAGIMATDYTLQFDAKPVRGGFAFLVGSDTLNVGAYVNYDAANGVISVHQGSTETSPLVTSANLSAPASLGDWHTVTAEVGAAEVKVLVDGDQVLSFDPSFATQMGSFGFGAAYTHACYFRNLNATTASGRSLMTASLTSEAELALFYVATNPQDTLIDGSKRDRIAYIGDVDVGLGSAFAVNWGARFVNGSINLLGSFQATPGFWVPSAKITQPPYAAGEIPTNRTGLIGHSFNFATSICRYYEFTGDAAFAQHWAPKVQKMLDWAATQLSSDGLFNVTDATFGMDWDWYDPPQVGAVAKFNAAYAYALQSAVPLLGAVGVDTVPYSTRLADLRAAMNAVLWDPTTGAYALSDTSPRDAFAQDANALAVLAGVAPDPASLLQTLNDTLIRAAGPLAFSEGAVAAGWAEQISPFASGWHLRAALATGSSDAALTLLRTLWAPMADPGNANYTGTFWETLDGQGRPGLPDPVATSLAHGFAAAPAAELSAYVLGVRPDPDPAAAPAPGAGLRRRWLVRPLTLGLGWVRGAHPLPDGLRIAVDWRFDDQDGLLEMRVEGPAGSNGTVYLPNPLRVPLEDSVLVVGNRTVTAKDGFEVKGGEVFELKQRRA
ncbi:Six-hairpin glycosidase [Xylariomycetidae sp. FL0641]|nr:Six-hairpin glycosidase [Xylariomycetidae sp. FL0641]